MGLREANEDGIKYYYDPDRKARGSRGTYVFCVPCDVCGELTESTVYGRNQRRVCPRCQDRRVRHKKEVEKAWYEVIEDKDEARFNKAIDRIEKQVKNLSKYERAIRIARQAKHKYGSIPEAMVAIELIRLGYSIIPQQKVGKYRVDFYIPKYKIVIEVDGAIYHQKSINNREATIQLSFGLDAKIIHIPAELISKDIRKLKKVMQLEANLP